MDGDTDMTSRIVLSAVIVAATAHAACPISECNYLDPQYQAATEAWSNCTKSVLDAFIYAMDGMALLYPRFGIAWQSQEAEMKAAASDPGNATAMDEVHRRFEDRILHTAEPEALEFYNLWKLKIKQQTERCGPMPEPPRKQP
jgi:hypothetical protein